MMDQSMGSMPPGEEQAPGYEICIKVDGQGAISVGVEQDSPEMGEDGEAGERGMMLEGMGAEGEQEYQPANSIKEALQMALAIFKNSGKATSQAEDQEAGFQSAMEQPQ